MKKNQELQISDQTDIGTILYDIKDMLQENPFSRDIYLNTLWINGIRYSENIDESMEDLRRQEFEEYRLRLVREPENIHDERAILVKDDKDRKIGYIPQSQNTVIANLMDAGKEVYAVLSFADVTIRNPYGIPWEDYEVKIRIYMRD